mmetsp:Transcript_137572/g.294081  ORF Transcript_137572/g.294081 Transcript_137572/m.294081 type:complete len:257 (-) Transcript_137572:64-834(-)
MQQSGMCSNGAPSDDYRWWNSHFQLKHTFLEVSPPLLETRPRRAASEGPSAGNDTEDIVESLKSRSQTSRSQLLLTRLDQFLLSKDDREWPVNDQSTSEEGVFSDERSDTKGTSCGEESKSSGQSLAETQQEHKATRRPSKHQRDRYRKEVARVMNELERHPDSFVLEDNLMLPSVAGNPTLYAKLQKRVNDHQAELKKKGITDRLDTFGSDSRSSSASSGRGLKGDAKSRQHALVQKEPCPAAPPRSRKKNVISL